MPPTPSSFPAFPPPEPLRRALMASFTHEHRPELADLIASADLLLDARGLWVRPAENFGSVSPAWLEPRLRAAACEAGLDLEAIHVVAGPRGGEA